MSQPVQAAAHIRPEALCWDAGSGPICPNRREGYRVELGMMHPNSVREKVYTSKIWVRSLILWHSWMQEVFFHRCPNRAVAKKLHRSSFSIACGRGHRGRARLGAPTSGRPNSAGVWPRGSWYINRLFGAQYCGHGRRGSVP
jgi:hypothetical protein